MATITFHGDLKRFASNSFELEVDTFSELMSGILTQIKGLRERLRKGYYKLKIGDKHYNTDEIKGNPNIQLNNNTEIHLTPFIVGAGKVTNAFQIVLGVALIAVAWWNPYNWVAGVQLMVGAMGATMALTGAVGLLTKPPQMENKIDEGDKQRSSSFSNLKNLTPQGRPLPLLYGKMMTSLILISQGVETFDEEDFARANKDKEERKKKEQEQNKPKVNSQNAETRTRDNDVGKDSRDDRVNNIGSSDNQEPERYSPDSYDDGDHGSDSDGGGGDSDDENSEGR
ncbi:tail assembly protein [Pasteurella multocida]|nr:tail assembly protein [Pasteurella multocida]